MKFLFICAFCLSLAACAAPNNRQETNANQNQPKPTVETEETAPRRNPAEAVTVSADKITLKPGASGEALIRLNIVAPFHINSNPPSEANLIATEIIAAAPKNLSFGKPIYPKGELKKFEFSDKPVSVYENSIVIKLPFKAAATGDFEQPLTLKFQPCDESVCYRPQTMNLILPVSVK